MSGTQSPSARHARREQQDRRHDRRVRARRLRLFSGLIGVLVLVGILSRLPDERPGNALDQPPDELVGTWVTTDPRYAQSHFSVEPDRLILGLAPGIQSTHAIESIRRDEVPVHRVYYITYLEDEIEMLFEVYVYDDGELRLKNPPEVTWVRGEPPASE